MLTSRQPIWIGWGKELIKFYNDPYKAIVGGKHPWALGSPASVVWKEIWPSIKPMLDQVMLHDEGTYVEEELLIMERNGYPEETYYTFSYTPIPGDAGGTAGMICANTDDTQRIISNRQLKTITGIGKALEGCKTDQEAYTRTIRKLADNQRDFTFVLIYTNNEDSWKLVAHSDLSSSAALKVIPKNDDGPLPQLIANAMRQHNSVVIEDLETVMGKMPGGAWEIRPHKGIILPIYQSGQNEAYGAMLIGANPYRLIDDKYLGFFTMIADQVATSISTVHAIEAERERLAALAEIDKAKTTFFSNISHEFRTPLTLLLGPIRDALNEADRVDANKQRMDVAWRNALRMQKLVNMLLDFSRIEAGRMDASFVNTGIGALTADLASTFRSAIEKAGMSLHVSIEKIDTPVAVDIDMWEKIVLNLLSNAFKYSSQGSIGVSLKKKGDKIELSISDTGSGIPEAELEKIFERFHRVQNVKGRSQEGTGIGLAMVRELVKLHGGHIWVESKVGEGSTFTVTIPVAQEELADNSIQTRNRLLHSETYTEEAGQWTPTDRLDLPERSGGKNKLKVLLADDNRDMRTYIHRLLWDEYEVIETVNGEDAFNKALETRPDLVISDIMMPVLDGFGLLEKIRNNGSTSNIPVIFLSARAGEESRVEGIRAGADDYLVKPFSSKELMAKVHSLIRLSQERLKNEMRLRVLFEQAPVAICILQGRDYVFELANNLYLELIDKDRSVVGKKLFDVMPELKTQGVREMADSVLDSGVPFIGNELKFHLNRNGRTDTCYFNFVYQPLVGDDGKATGIFVAAHEVTSQVIARLAIEKYSVQLEDEVASRTADLKRSNEELLRTNRELEQFAYVSSHDLQEPLRKIQTFAGMIKDKNYDIQYTTKYIDKIDISAARMSELIKDVLRYSKATKEENKFESVDLNVVLKNVGSDFELLIDQKKAKIVSDVLPIIRGNGVQIHQLFANLVSNALKFSDRRPEIKVKYRLVKAQEVPDFHDLDRRRDYHLLTFSDNGIGFDQEHAEQIFGLFNRLQNRADYGGTGIGLSLCKKIAENHQGIIKARSVKGEGATFEIFLPVNLNASKDTSN